MYSTIISYISFKNNKLEYSYSLEPGQTVVSIDHVLSVYLSSKFFYEGIEVISCRKSWPKSLLPGTFPSSLKILDMGNYEHEILPGVVPEGCTLFLDAKYEYPLPEGLNKIIFYEIPPESHIREYCNKKPIHQMFNKYNCMHLFGGYFEFYYDITNSDLVSSIETTNKKKTSYVTSTILRILGALVLLYCMFGYLSTGTYYRSNIDPCWVLMPIIFPGVFKKDIETLKFRNFNKELTVGIFPSTLKSLDLGNDFNQRINLNVLPENLEELYLHEKFNQVIEQGAIPKGCHLHLPMNYNHVLPHGISNISFTGNPLYAENVLQNYKYEIKYLIKKIEDV